MNTYHVFYTKPKKIHSAAFWCSPKIGSGVWGGSVMFRCVLLPKTIQKTISFFPLEKPEINKEMKAIILVKTIIYYAFRWLCCLRMDFFSLLRFFFAYRLFADIKNQQNTYTLTLLEMPECPRITMTRKMVVSELLFVFLPLRLYTGGNVGKT